MYNYDPGSPEFQEIYRIAQRRVRAKMSFYSHLASFVLVNGLLILIYLVSGPLSGSYNYPWFVWPLGGWGIGLLFHFSRVFVFMRMRRE